MPMRVQVGLKSVWQGAKVMLTVQVNFDVYPTIMVSSYVNHVPARLCQKLSYASMSVDTGIHAKPFVVVFHLTRSPRREREKFVMVRITTVMVA